jgi:hypothetical protein
MDKWINIPDFPNYEASNNGGIRNKTTRKLLNPWDDGRGYLQVDVNGQTIRVHKLIASAFYDCTVNGLVVNHIDGNKKNNFIGNLEWCTQADNMRHAHRTGLIPHNGQGGLPRKMVKIVETGIIYESLQSCASDINGCRSHIGDCLRGIRKSHRNFHFEEV